MDAERVDVLSGKPAVINIGLPEFFESLETQGIEVIHVDWRPPAEVDEEMIDLLDKVL